MTLSSQDFREQSSEVLGTRLQSDPLNLEPQRFLTSQKCRVLITLDELFSTVTIELNVDSGFCRPTTTQRFHSGYS